MKDRIRRFMLGESQDLLHGLDFEAVALSLYRWQRQKNRDYDAFCGSSAPTCWQEIPAVPVTLFRDLSLCCFDPTEAGVHFRTSGTTGRRGSHRLLDTELYDLGARRHAEAVLGPLPVAGISLVSQASDSSLGHMCAHFVSGASHHVDSERGLDREGAWDALRVQETAVFVPMTGLAAAGLLEGAWNPCPLPDGSMIMITGGFKGRQTQVDAQALEELLCIAFPGVRLVGEYGMTELSSQLWSPSLGEPFVPPPWMRVLAVDPWTGDPAAEGILRFFDLANHQSVMALETQDLGRVLEDGRVELLGRLAGSEARGCSLGLEEAHLRRLMEAPPDPPAPHEAHAAAVQAAPLPPHIHLPGVAHDESCGHHSASAPMARPLRSEDVDRIDRVMTALAALRRVDPGTLGDGLSRSQVMGTLGMAIGGVNREGLELELSAHRERPEDVVLVVARGVFTAPIEWVALYAAAGIRVNLKAPRGADSMCQALARVFQAHGLPVHCQLDRELGEPTAVVAFGSDESLEQIRAATPSARHALFGHRLSVAITGSIHSQVLAWEVAHYDTRGCMAPAAVFCLQDPTPQLDALQEAMYRAQRAMPRGLVDGSLGPEWRRRIGLARRHGVVIEGEDWAITLLPAEYFHPVALPRMLSLHAVADEIEIYRALAPWRENLSTLGTDDLLRPWRTRVWEEIYGWFPRRVALGQMQRPSIPRMHDGVEMLGSICTS